MSVDVLKIMQSKYKTPWEFNFDHMFARPLLSYISMKDIEDLRRIATSIKLSSRIKEKQRRIGEIMSSRGFRRFAGGTNRIVYACYEDPTILIKIAVDRVGMNDNPDELRAQQFIKPFCSKMYEVSPCGTVGLCERVVPIKSKEEFKQIAEDVFEIISRKIVGKYVMDDIGTDYFLNWGIRPGFGPVLVDFPYLYDLDGDKLFCNKILEDGTKCCGEIDYDAGFNHLYCQKCGKMYKAIDLKSDISQNKIIIGETINGGIDMKVKVITDGEVIAEIGTNSDSYMHHDKRKGKFGNLELSEADITPMNISVSIDGEQYTPNKNKTVDITTEVSSTEDDDKSQENKPSEIVTKKDTIVIPDGFEIDEDDDNENEKEEVKTIDNRDYDNDHDFTSTSDKIDDIYPSTNEDYLSEEENHKPIQSCNTNGGGNTIKTKKASYITREGGIKINQSRIFNNINPAQASRKDYE